MYLERLGPYELDEPLGKGGMGTVYRAFHRDTGEKAAVKALAPLLAATEGFRDRFEAEIESLKLLRHPGIVRLLGYGEEAGLLFYAMELVEGTSLEEELRGGRRFTWREVTDFGIQVCRALKHAHDHGVIHRDIKPANLLIDHDGRIKIADFGIARLFGSTQLTSAGGVLGTADYMPPEQIDSRNVTERSDQYSLGGVMYALLAGRPPFRAKSLPEMLQLQRFAEPEPVRRYAPDAPEQLERLIMQLLSKDPASRFPNTLVLARHMEAMLRALSRPAPDDFALAFETPEPPAGRDGPFESIGMETTRIEPGGLGAASADEASIASQPSSLSAADKATVRRSDVTGTMKFRRRTGGDEMELEAPVDRTGRGNGAVEVRAATRFRTVDDDLLEARQAEGASRFAFAAQVVGLVGSLILIGLAIWYFSRPSSANDLHAQIELEAREGQSDALRTVERQIDEFLERFPNDPRAQEIAGYKEEIEISRMESRIHRNVRRRLGGKSLAPIEQLYLEATRKAETDPAEAIRDLQSILVLYHQDVETAEPAPKDASPPSPSDSTENGDDADARASDAKHVVGETAEYNRRVEDCLLLIQRRLSQLTEYMQMEADHQLPVLRRRLAAAQAVQPEDPVRARRLYRAIVDLYQGKQWARGVVEEAVAALAVLDGTAAGDASRREADKGQASENPDPATPSARRREGWPQNSTIMPSSATRTSGKIRFARSKSSGWAASAIGLM